MLDFFNKGIASDKKNFVTPCIMFVNLGVNLSLAAFLVAEQNNNDNHVHFIYSGYD